MSRWFTDYGLDAVADRLIVGALPSDEDDVSVLAARGVRRVVNLVDDGEYRAGARAAIDAAYRAHQIMEARLPSEDHGHLSVDLLERVSTLTAAALDDGSVVYLHCRAGWQRSVIGAAAALARSAEPSDRAPLDALRAVIGARRGADPLPHQIADLLRWWASRGA